MKEAYKKLDKIVVNVGVGRLSSQPNFDKVLPELIQVIGVITGQKPATIAAKKSIAGFKLRMGTVVGLKVTLRGQRMRDFLERLVNIVFPRVKDFRGINLQSVDQSGNLSTGFKEHVVFPEVAADITKVNFSLEITLVPKLKNRGKAVELYKSLGVPLKK